MAETLLAVRRAAPQLLSRIQNGISNPPVELVYTSHAKWPLPPGSLASGGQQLTMSILDSSFNPPTKAHMALANSKTPESASSRDYDARLLLLSVKNVDKTLKSGDATYLQRLEMMSLLVHHLPSSAPGDPKNVAIAITDEPTFVGKASVISRFMAQRLSSFVDKSEVPRIEFTFLLGLDTLDRLFAPRYYSSDADMASSLRKLLSPDSEGDSCRMIFANRDYTPSSTEKNPSISLQLRKEFEDSGRIMPIQLDPKLGTYSSSAVRELMLKGGISSSGNETPIWKDMVTTEVADYVQEHQLYKSTS